MGLPWVRLDSNIATHDKILALLTRRNGRGIAFSYCCALAYSGGNGTDGHIPFAALPFIHATKKDVETMVEVGLLDPDPYGWTIRNWADRQQLTAVSESLRAGQRRGALKANCVRWHGPACGCWENAS